MKLGINKTFQIRILAVAIWLIMVIIAAWLVLSGIVMELAGGNIVIGLIIVLILLGIGQAVFIMMNLIGGKKGANDKLPT